MYQMLIHIFSTFYYAYKHTISLKVKFSKGYNIRKLSFYRKRLNYMTSYISVETTEKVSSADETHCPG